MRLYAGLGGALGAAGGIYWLLFGGSGGPAGASRRFESSLAGLECSFDQGILMIAAWSLSKA